VRTNCCSLVNAAIAICAAALCTDVASAHHAPTEYDFQKVIEIDGTLSEVSWRNPHVRILLRIGTHADGKPMIVDVEGSALSVMRRTNATPEGLHLGDRVRVAGHPSRRGAERLFGLNLLQADGRELLLAPGLDPRWAKAPLGSVTNWFDRKELESTKAGIFRVWSSVFDEFLVWNPETLPLTAAARSKVAAWDLVNDSVTKGCAPVGMPAIMDNPYPLEFVRKGNVILLRMEIYDAVRTIHIGTVEREALQRNPFGRSIGHWEGDTLVVATDGITWSYFDHLGTPLSPATHIVERFSPTADGSRLQYKMIVNDPVNLKQPMELTRSWMARANESVKPYECLER
jgi:hypothetical protein